MASPNWEVNLSADTCHTNPHHHYCGWLQNPAPVDRCFIPLVIGFQHVSTILLVVQDFACPSTASIAMNLSVQALSPLMVRCLRLLWFWMDAFGHDSKSRGKLQIVTVCIPYLDFEMILVVTVYKYTYAYCFLRHLKELGALWFCDRKLRPVWRERRQNQGGAGDVRCDARNARCEMLCSNFPGPATILMRRVPRRKKRSKRSKRSKGV